MGNITTSHIPTEDSRIRLEPKWGESTDKFLVGELAYAKHYPGIGKVMTAPYRIGMEYDILGMSGLEQLVKAKWIKAKVGIDNDVCINAIYVKVKDSILRFHIANYTASDFKPVEGTDKYKADVYLHDIAITKDTKDALNRHTEWSDYLAIMDIQLKCDIKLEILLDVVSGFVETREENFRIRSVYLTNGGIPSDSSKLLRLFELMLKDSEVIGFDLNAFYN